MQCISATKNSQSQQNGLKQEVFFTPRYSARPIYAIAGRRLRYAAPATNPTLWSRVARIVSRQTISGLPGVNRHVFRALPSEYARATSATGRAWLPSPESFAWATWATSVLPTPSVTATAASVAYLFRPNLHATLPPKPAGTATLALAAVLADLPATRDLGSNEGCDILASQPNTEKSEESIEREPFFRPRTISHAFLELSRMTTLKYYTT